MVIILVVIGGYYIGDYFILLFHIILVDIGAY